MAIEYVGCTEGKGISPTTEIGGAIGGTLRVVANASLKLAYRKTKQEDTPVALEIVKDCMEIARVNSSTSDPEQPAASDYEQQFARAIEEWKKQQVDQTPTITLSSSSAKVGDQVTVTGSRFWPNEVVDIQLHASPVAQVTADESGAFSAEITVPPGAPPPDFPTAITASGNTSAKTARAPFHTTP